MLTNDSPFASRPKAQSRQRRFAWIPDGVTVLEVEKMGGETFEVEKKGDRIVAIRWKRNIPPKESADFFFRARNPIAGAV